MRTKVWMYPTALTVALAAAFGTQAHAEAPDAALDATHIAIVNSYEAPIRVLAEDATGTLREVAVVRPGEVRTVETTTDGSDAPVRLHAQPTNSRDRLSTWGDVGIATDPLDLVGDVTAIFWLENDLARSRVEIRAR